MHDYSKRSMMFSRDVAQKPEKSTFGIAASTVKWLSWCGENLQSRKVKSFLKGIARDILAMIFVFLLCILLFGSLDSGLDRARQRIEKQPDFNYHSTLGR